MVPSGSATRDPRLVYAELKYICRAPRDVVVHPLYLRIPPGHARKWRKYGHKWPAYFAQGSLCREVYVPQYRERHRDDDHDWHDGRDHDQGDRGKHRDRGRGRN